MAVSLPSLSTVVAYPASSSSLPFYDRSNGSFTLPPLQDGFERRGSIMLDSYTSNNARRASHVRRDSGASDTTAPSNSPDSPTLPSLDPLSIADRSSVTLPPKIHHRTKPSESHSRRQSVSSKPTAPAFKLIPQPMLDPSKRPIRSSDALVVFPSTAGISQASQKKAKLLIGKDVERYFQLQEKQALVAPGLSLPRAYAYKVVWEKRWSESFVKVMNKVEGGRRMSLAMDVDR